MPFGLCAFAAFALLPAPIGTQDLTALFVHRAAAAQQQAPASPFETLHLATFRFPQPVGTGIPRYRLASLDPRAPIGAEPPPAPPREFPSVNRRLKGDSLLHVPEAGPSPSAIAREAHAALAPELGSELAAEPEPRLDAPVADSEWLDFDPAGPSQLHNPAMDTARLYFGADSLDAPLSTLDPAEPEEQALVPLPEARPTSGETVAGKGEVTGKGRHPSSPAERLGLKGKARDKAEKCLAEAVYFESRGEAVRGQIAVAQVVMNRVFSEFYPDTVCEVVYQNAHRRLACQFTFACDGIRDVVNDADAWRRAKRIAKGTLDGKLWLDDVGKATHYHASWVRPWWIRTMRKLHRIGVHTFYRPRRWGDGSDEPVWGDAVATANAAKTL